MRRNIKSDEIIIGKEGHHVEWRHFFADISVSVGYLDNLLWFRTPLNQTMIAFDLIGDKTKRVHGFLGEKEFVSLYHLIGKRNG